MNRILVYDGPDDQSMLIGELSGTPSHKVMKSISSSGKSMFINFINNAPNVPYPIINVKLSASIFKFS